MLQRSPRAHALRLHMHKCTKVAHAHTNLPSTMLWRSPNVHALRSRMHIRLPQPSAKLVCSALDWGATPFPHPHSGSWLGMTLEPGHDPNFRGGNGNPILAVITAFLIQIAPTPTCYQLRAVGRGLSQRISSWPLHIPCPLTWRDEKVNGGSESVG